jgi:hypothetical protein
MPGCGRWFDMRDVGEVVEHIHDASEIEMADGRCLSSVGFEHDPKNESAL